MSFDASNRTCGGGGLCAYVRAWVEVVFESRTLLAVRVAFCRFPACRSSSSPSTRSLNGHAAAIQCRVGIMLFLQSPTDLNRACPRGTNLFLRQSEGSIDITLLRVGDLSNEAAESRSFPDASVLQASFGC